MTTTLTWGGRQGATVLSLIREGRPCDPQEIKNQIGMMTMLGVSGGRVAYLKDEQGDTVGLLLPITHDRRIEVVLDFSDTYTVSRIRFVKRGKDANTEVVEARTPMVYCDQLAEIVLDLSAWK